MFDHILKLVLDTATVHYRIDKVCTDVQPVACETVMSVSHNESLSRILFLLEARPAYLHGLFAVDEDIDSIVIGSPMFCDDIIVNKDFTYSLEIAQPDKDRVRESNLSLDCTPIRSTNSYISTLNTEANLSLTQLAQEIVKTKILANHNLYIEEINSNLVFLYNPDAEKNIILDKNYWEYITLLISKDNYTVNVILDGSYGTGYNPPHVSEFRSSAISFRDEMHKFFLRIKQSL